MEPICFWFPSPFSPVGPDWRNVSSCERWLPCCGICPVAGRLALLLGQPDSPPSFSLHREHSWRDGERRRSIWSLFSISVYSHWILRSLRCHKHSESSEMFLVLTVWPCCRLRPLGSTTWGSLEQDSPYWVLTGSKYFVCVYGKWLFSSIFAPKNNFRTPSNSWIVRTLSSKTLLNLMHIASEVNIDLRQDGRDISNISYSFSVALIDSLSCL